MTFSISVGVTGVTKKLLHCEVVKNSTKDLSTSCIVLANVGPIEEKYLLKALQYFWHQLGCHLQQLTMICSGLMTVYHP